MADIEIPFPFRDIPVKPELTGKVKVTDDVTQTLATLLAWDGSARKLLRTALSGALQTSSPQLQGVKHKTTASGPEVIQLEDIPTTEVMLKAASANSDTIWLDVIATPLTTVSWPLAANDVIVVNVDNLNRLRVLIETTADRLIYMYSR